MGSVLRRVIGPAVLVALLVALLVPLALGRSLWLRDSDLHLSAQSLSARSPRRR